jgi:RNA polymerase sigma factor (sigma-70 family)
MFPVTTSREAAWQVVLENDGLVKKATNDWCRLHSDRVFEDFIGEAYIAALRAVEIHDPSRAELSTWMYRLIQQHLNKEALKESRQTQIVSRDEEGKFHSREMSIPVLFEDSPPEEDAPQGWAYASQPKIISEPSFEDDLVDRIVTDENWLQVSMVILEKLTPVEQEVLSQHYFEGMTFEAIGAERGVSRQRIDQIHKKALGKIREALEVPA